MKILLLYREPFDRKITSKIVAGGGEMFCRSIYENFDDVIVYYVPYAADNEWNIKRKNKEQRNIINFAEDNKVDVILSNYPNAIYNGSVLQKSHIPIMSIFHNVYAFTTIVNRMNGLTHNGHSVFFVSKWQHKRYTEMTDNIRKRNGDDGPYGNKHPTISGYINPSYCKINKKIANPIWDCGTIGRCDSSKKPFLLRKLLKDTDMKNLIISGKYQTENDKKYYEKNKELDNVEWDIEYDKVIDNLSKFKTYFSTWNGETWGITALEALSCGVPLILNGCKDGTHASEMIPADKNHYKVIPTNDKEELIKAIKSFDNVDRKEIKEMTLEKHSLEKWKSNLANGIDKTIDTFAAVKLRANNNLAKYINEVQ